MRLTRAAVGGFLIGLGIGIWIGMGVIAGSDMNGMSVGPSLLMAMVGSVLVSTAYRGRRLG